MADQALSVGGMLLVNLVLARTQTKEEYGMFGLSYSVFTFLAGLHNAAILEPFTVYGSGRYRDRFSSYFRLMARLNVVAALVLTASLLSLCLIFRWIAPHLVSRALVGLGCTVGILLSGSFLRRAFYVQRQAILAAKTSLVFFITIACGLSLAATGHALNSLSVFLLLALGWIAGGVAFGARLPFGGMQGAFIKTEPDYWREHWKYMRWVLTTAFVFQLTSQGYYWLVAGFLSLKEVAELKAMLMLVAPADQVFIALNYLALPILATHFTNDKILLLLSVWKWYAVVIAAVTAFFVVVAHVFGRAITHAVYGGKYDDVATLLSWLAFLPLVMGIGHTMNAALKAAELPRLVFLGYVCSGAVTFVAGIPLVIHFGLQGAVYGLLLSGATYTSALAVSFVLTFYRRIQPAAVAR